ncbi:uncharacterized protein B0H64DRAFT_476539 [Chaetomium fimeti]|uniref:Mid2 domain-containing protein n=1 Tax=Chaetomium fimeti TaxID=1854472 RepID=A0AAE0LPR9_9PEZI|nr:hypothetical protein B0H64DRAFT_476539 [Chaetomium fimeti]
MRALTLAIISLLFLAHLCLAQKQCYYPNGQIAVNDSPCDPDADDSPCCAGGQGTTCLSNKLCRGPDGNTVRGSCTDKRWDSPDCALFCLTANTGGTDLISCANVTGSDTTYCCDNHRAYCCDSGVARFEVLPPKPQILANWDDRASAFLPFKQTTSSSTSSKSTSTSTRPPTNSSTPPPYPTASTPTSNTQLPGTSADPIAAPTLPLAAQAGIGAGAGVLAIALAAVAYLVFKLRRNKWALQAEKQRDQRLGGDQHRGFGPGPRYKYKADGGMGGVGGNGGGAAAWYHPPAYGEQQQQPYQGGVGLGVVPRQELDAWPNAGYGQQPQGQAHGQGYVARFELPSTPGRGPGRAF